MIASQPSLSLARQLLRDEIKEKDKPLCRHRRFSFTELHPVLTPDDVLELLDDVRGETHTV